MPDHVAGYATGVLWDEIRNDWDDLNPRPIRWSCWYPAPIHSKTSELLFGGRTENSLFNGGPIARDAPVSTDQSKWPLVLLSHGTGGTASGMTWLGRRLATEGFICLGVDHHGNTGSEPYRAEGFIRWWERSTDLSFIIDNLSQIDSIRHRVDTARISAAGFSLGGYTALSLAGAITSVPLFENWLSTQPNSVGGPREFPNADKEIPGLLQHSHRFRQSWDRQSLSFADPRITTCIAIAPAPTVRAFTHKSLSEIECSTLILCGEADSEASFEQCSVWLKTQNQRFQLLTMGENVGHYTFLPECTEHGRSRAPEICTDHRCVSRADIHDQASATILRFLNSECLS